MLTIRSAQISDVPQILCYVRELAEYERQMNAVLATEADFLREGFGPNPHYNCIMAEWDGQPAGFALWFYNFSTWRGRAGIHLEDLFVCPVFRGNGIGTALLARVAAIAVEQNCPRRRHCRGAKLPASAMGCLGLERFGDWLL